MLTAASRARSTPHAPEEPDRPAAKTALGNAAHSAFGPGYVIAFVAVTFAAFMQAYAASASVPRERLTSLSAACIVYALVGTFGAYVAERNGGRAPRRVVLVVLLAIGAYATLLSRGYTAMMLLAAVSASVFSLGSAGSMVVGALCAALALWGFLLRSPFVSAVLQAEAAFASGVAFVYVFSRVAVRERLARSELERVAAQLALANAQLATQADQAEELATLNERNRIAREIHDGLGHYLTVVHVQLQAAELLVGSDPTRARDAVVKAQQLTRDGLDEVRRSVSLLRGRDLPLTLEDALRGLMERFGSEGARAQLRIDGEPRELAEVVHRALYRAAQEGLTNSQRHARAAKVELEVRYEAHGVVRLTVRDDGVGATMVDGGYGLLGVRERVALLGGKVAIHTRPGAGFTLEVEVPA